MKILWISHVVPFPPKGGLFQRSFNLIKQLAIENDVHLVALNQNKLLPNKEKIRHASDELKRFCQKVDVFPIVTDNTKLSWGFMTFRSYFNDKPYDVNWLYNKDMRFYINNLAANDLRRYDIVHVDAFGVYPYSTAFKHSRIVLNHHNIESDMMHLRQDRENNVIKKIYFKKESKKIEKYEKIICHSCDLNLVVSDLDQTRLKNISGDVNITVIPNGVDLEYFKPKNPEHVDSSGIIFAGGMSYYPNREAARFFASDIWPILKDKSKNITATFIGKNPPKELLDIADGKNVIVPGFVEDVRPYFDKAKIYICPIKNGGGTRLKIIDALAMSKPLVATGMSVEGLDLREGEHFLRAETGEDFVNRIIQLENDHGLCRHIGFNGRKYVEKNFSWDDIGNKMRNDYRSLLNK